MEFQHVKPGKGGLVRTKLRNLRTGSASAPSAPGADQAILERKTLEFLYSTNDEYVFMDTETFEQTILARLDHRVLRLQGWFARKSPCP